MTDDAENGRHRPRYMKRRILADGTVAFYWAPHERDVAAGFSIDPQPLGSSYLAACHKADVLNEQLDSWRKRKRQRPEGARGYVYFIRAGKLIKIGFSKRPFNRASALKTGIGDPISFMIAVRGTRGLEARLHEELRHYRTSGEWFVAALPVLERISALMSRFVPFSGNDEWEQSEPISDDNAATA